MPRLLESIILAGPAVRRFALSATLVIGLWPIRASAAQETPAVWGIVPGDSGSPHAGAALDQVVPKAAPQEIDSASGRRGEFVVAPLPIINPTIDNGAAMVVGYLYHLDPTDRTGPPSMTLGAGFGTSNGSWGGAALQQFHFHRDRYRVLAAGAYGSVNYDYFGIGQDAGADGVSIPLEQTGTLALAEGLVLFGRRWYAGGRYQFMKTAVGIDQSALDSPPPIPLPDRDIDLRTATVGPRLQRDSRDNPFYPSQGMLVDAIVGFYGKAVGGQRSYQSYQASFSQYLPVGTRQVVAWRLSGCRATGDVPFYDLCLLGKAQDLRGYVTGQFRDRLMLASQVEYRTELWWRLGATAFLGAGEVGSSASALSGDKLVPGGGVGLRLVVAKKNHVNLRADYAWGKDSHAFYVGVGEAF